MSAEAEGRTEAPTAGRLEQSRKEGSTAVSRDIVMTAGFAAGAITLYIVGASLLDSMVHMVSVSLSRVSEGTPRDLLAVIGRPAALTGLISLLGVVAIVAATLLQTNFGWWWSLTVPRFDKLFSSGRMKQVFSTQALTTLGMTTVKFVALGFTLWLCLRDEFVTLPRMLHLGPDDLMAAMFAPMGKALVKVVAVLIVLAGVDFAITKHRFTEQLKMTKEEVKREYKDEEGDPAIKSKRKGKHRELLRGIIAKEIPRADVLVVNPTHIAIALRYKADEDRAPRVTAKGMGDKAEKMRELAREHGIPIVENIQLARLLYRKVRVGRAVPAETFKTVAAILAFVYRALGKNGHSIDRSNEAHL